MPSNYGYNRLLITPLRNRTEPSETLVSRSGNSSAKTEQTLNSRSEKSNKSPFISQPVEKWPLDDLPMDVDMSKCLQTTGGCKEWRISKKIECEKATNLSDNLLKYGKRLFDIALDKSSSDGGVTVQLPQTVENLRAIRTLRTSSGPTWVGSPIHNDKIQLMNRIRQRPATMPETEPIFVKDRTRFPPLNQRMERSNDYLKVKYIGDSVKSTMSHPELMMLVVDENTMYTGPLEEAVEEQPAVTEVELKAVVEPTPLPKKAAPKSKRKKKHWVDMLTVSSVKSQNLEDTNVKPKEEKVTPAQKQDDQLQTDGEDAEFLSLEDLRERNMTLPEFVCPSSEDKSREFAVKQWLSATKFKLYPNYVPAAF